MSMASSRADARAPYRSLLAVFLAAGVELQGNHAKLGVSTGARTYAIFGDMNQQGSLSGPNCNSSQNGRGGLFYVVENADLFGSVRDLITGDTAPVK
jgi:hypothetical protein